MMKLKGVPDAQDGIHSSFPVNTSKEGCLEGVILVPTQVQVC